MCSWKPFLQACQGKLIEFERGQMTRRSNGKAAGGLLQSIPCSYWCQASWCSGPSPQRLQSIGQRIECIQLDCRQMMRRSIGKASGKAAGGPVSICVLQLFCVKPLIAAVDSRHCLQSTQYRVVDCRQKMRRSIGRQAVRRLGALSPVLRPHARLQDPGGSQGLTPVSHCAPTLQCIMEISSSIACALLGVLQYSLVSWWTHSVSWTRHVLHASSTNIGRTSQQVQVQLLLSNLNVCSGCNACLGDRQPGNQAPSRAVIRCSARGI